MKYYLQYKEAEVNDLKAQLAEALKAKDLPAVVVDVVVVVAVELDWLNISLNTNKMNCKKTFLM